jgi:hypothetical protein
MLDEVSRTMFGSNCVARLVADRIKVAKDWCPSKRASNHRFSNVTSMNTNCRLMLQTSSSCLKSQPKGHKLFDAKSKMAGCCLCAHFTHTPSCGMRSRI